MEFQRCALQAMASPTCLASVASFQEGSKVGAFGFQKFLTISDDLGLADKSLLKINVADSRREMIQLSLPRSFQRLSVHSRECA